MSKDKGENVAVILANITAIGSTLGCLCWAVRASAGPHAEVDDDDLEEIRETLEGMVRTAEWKLLNSVLDAVNQDVLVRRRGPKGQGGEPCQN